MLVLWGADNWLLYNDACREVLGDKHPLSLGCSATEVFAEAWDRLWPLVERVKETGEAAEAQERYLPEGQDGQAKDIWLNFSFSPVRDEDGRIEGVLAVAQDVTEQVKARRELQRNENRLRLLIDSIQEGFCLLEIISDVEGKPCDYLIQRVNPAFEAHVGVRGAEGKRQSELAEHLGGEWIQAFSGVAETRQAKRMTARCQQTGHWLDVRVFPVPGERRGRVVVLCFDITPQRASQDALRESEERFRLLVESTAQAVWETDADGRVVQDSPSWREYTGQSVEEWLGQGWLNAVHPEERERCLKNWQRALHHGEKLDAEYRLWRKGEGWTWTQVQAAPLRDGDGHILKWVGMNHDVTYRKRVEESLRENDRRKNEFLATLAHELRNPLAPIRSGLAAMKQNPTDRELQEEVCDMMERQVDQMVHLIDDLLDVSRITRGKLQLRKERLRLGEVIDRAVEASRPIVEEASHSLQVSLPEENPTIEVDPTRLAQVLANLLVNAAKYTPAGGKIQLRAAVEGQTVRLEVEDDGVGISPEMLERIFEMFVQIDMPHHQDTRGLGIGLTLVKSIVEMHGGTIRVHSDGPDKGSLFTVQLPVVAREAKTAVDHREASAADEQGHGQRILVVDDNASAARMMSIVLGNLGYTVRSAGDGFEALQVAEQFRPQIILMDLGMPEMDGYEAARQLREMDWGQEVYLLALTGWGQEEDRQRTREAGFDGHLIKPVKSADLRAALAEIQESHER
ncbi:MAG: PAS/PAC sensor hybrid histidine kinase [Puniceicoccaceae bacterium 5H]|nr:MAG: PAS/PAC sensor hybrid histidine kinase [Puniceicoccaceae bacterium 5H]